MKQKMLKKMLNTAFALIFALTAVLSFVVPDVALAASDFVLTQVCTNTPLTQGETFKITINMKNISDTGDDITNVVLDFSLADIAVLTDGGTTAAAAPGTVATDGGVAVALGQFDMRFIGDGSTGLMPVKVNYKLNGIAQTPTTVNLYLDVETPATPGPTPDPDLFKPDIIASVDEGTTVTAGSYIGVKVTLKNQSLGNGARNVTITPSGEAPFDQVRVLTATPITELKANTSTDVNFSINANKFSKEGIYPFKFNLNYIDPLGKQATTALTVNIKVQNANKDTKLIIMTNAGSTVSATAGHDFTMPMNLNNSGSFYAKDITISLDGLSQDTFTLYSGNGEYIFDRIEGSANKLFDVKLTASKSLKTGSYPVSFKIEYTTEKGDKVSDTQQIWVPVTGSGDSASALEVLEVKPSMTTVTAKDTFDVTVKIKNSGSVKAEQIKVSADGTASLLPVTQNLFIVPSMAPGETKSLTFKFQPSPDAKRGGIPIVIKVESADGSGQNSTISQAVSIFLDASETGTDPSKDVPKIIVGTYSYDPQVVKAGEKFTLKMSFINTHSSKTIRNIKGNFTVTESSNQTGNVFTPVNSSNTFYIDQISPKGTCDWSLELYTIPDALSKTYTVTIAFNYEDEQGNPFTENEIIGIPVYQPSRLEVSDISLPPESPVGQPVYVPFNIFNMGKTTIYNVRMSVEGDFDAQPKSQYFGNYDPGYQEYVELNLVPSAPGMGKGKIVIQYETSDGQLQTFEKEFSMNVIEMQMGPGGDMPVDGGKFPVDPGMGGKDGMGGEPVKAAGGFIGSLLFFIIIGVVVVGVIVTIIVVRKRRKQKELDF